MTTGTDARYSPKFEVGDIITPLAADDPRAEGTNDHYLSQSYGHFTFGQEYTVMRFGNKAADKEGGPYVYIARDGVQFRSKEGDGYWPHHFRLVRPASGFKPGDSIRLVRHPVEGYCDIGELFTVAERPAGNDAGTDVVQVVFYKGRNGSITWRPAAYFELAEVVGSPTADEPFTKGQLVECVAAGGNPADDQHVALGRGYRVRKYHARSGASGLLELRGVPGKWSTQRFKRSTGVGAFTLGKADLSEVETRLMAFISGGPDFASVFGSKPFAGNEMTLGWMDELPSIEGACCGHVHDGNAPNTDVTKPSNPKDAIGSTKLPLDLVPSTLNAMASLAFTEGALKYGRYNWRVAGVRSSIYKSAFERHMMKWWNGEDIDPKTKVPHLASMLACIGILVDAAVVGKLNDDRPPYSPVGEMIDGADATIAHLKELFKEHNPRQYTIADTVTADASILLEVAAQSPIVTDHLAVEGVSPSSLNKILQESPRARDHVEVAAGRVEAPRFTIKDKKANYWFADSQGYVPCTPDKSTAFVFNTRADAEAILLAPHIDYALLYELDAV